ncbi:MAG: hypothetical protein J3R72DRAFT_118678 [Linnemannia gamsii]|nr:MAG: hypothetical protein J3R72DRAFT_118678 [Linnemannia gamsii]
MSSYQTYSSHHSNSNNNNSNNNNSNNYNSPTSPPRSYQSRSGSPVTLTPSSPRSTGGSGVHNNNTGSDSLTPIYTIDYNHNHHTEPVGAQRSVSPALGSPTSTLSGSIAGASSRSTTFNSQKRTASPTMAFSNTPLPEPTKWKRVRLTVMRLATVERLQLLWGLLAIFGTVSWISLMPAFSFRNGLGRGTFKDPAYTLCKRTC